eukprot:PhM_4_TR17013/c0_g1_i1/m.65397/K12619/XRN2, RAT1; 5'-3' exoribonuclease 2
MGVPGYFKWLITRCQSMTVKLAEIDNLYLDMNGILHPACHGDDSGPLTEDEMLEKFCGVLDEIITTLHPRKLVYFAFDGPAPVAKMVQQRSRRFCSEHNARVDAKLHKKMEAEWAANGMVAPSLKKHWDSNQITPGTPFMERVMNVVEDYIARRLTDPAYEAYRDVVMLLSDSSDPGEGEHKLVQFAKKQRQQPGYDPTTSHCFVGMDADLIQLALSMHDPNVYIYRETNLISLRHIREYFRACFSPILEEESVPEHLKDFERLLDDLLLCFCFVGNDFLPHLPQMKIASNAIGRCLAVYVASLPRIGDFLTHGSNINIKALDMFVRALANVMQAVQEPVREVAMWYERIEKSYIRDMEMQDYHGASLEQGFFSLLKRRSELYAWKKSAKLLAFDEVVVGTAGWQTRYYAEHFPELPISDSVVQVSNEYVRGLQWVMHYYHRDCPDWTWSFPFAHGPTLDNIFPALATPETVRFPNPGKPLLPMQQLVAVLPRRGAENILPPSLVSVMDKQMKPWFPDVFKSDCGNAPPRWMEFALLPEMEWDKLRAATLPAINKLSAEERQRNINRGIVMLVHKTHPIAIETEDTDPAAVVEVSHKPEQNKRLSLAGTVTRRLTHETADHLLEGVVQYTYAVPAAEVAATYLATQRPPEPEGPAIITSRNSMSPLSCDNRLNWSDFPPFRFHLWGVEITDKGELQQPAQERMGPGRGRGGRGGGGGGRGGGRNSYSGGGGGRGGGFPQKRDADFRNNGNNNYGRNSYAGHEGHDAKRQKH